MDEKKDNVTEFADTPEEDKETEKTSEVADRSSADTSAADTSVADKSADNKSAPDNETDDSVAEGHHCFLRDTGNGPLRHGIFR